MLSTAQHIIKRLRPVQYLLTTLGHSLRSHENENESWNRVSGAIRNGNQRKTKNETKGRFRGTRKRASFSCVRKQIWQGNRRFCISFVFVFQWQSGLPKARNQICQSWFGFRVELTVRNGLTRGVFVGGSRAGGSIPPVVRGAVQRGCAGRAYK